MVGKDGGPPVAGRCFPAESGKPASEEDIVAENERDGIRAYEFPADQEGLGQPVGLRLLRVGQTDPERGRRRRAGS